MSAFEVDFPWLKPEINRLQRYIQQRRIPQALLITGAKGLGKLHLARSFVQEVLCMSPENKTACGICQSCKLLQANSHPDYLQIEPESPDKAIGIAIIRQLINQLTLKPQFDGQRIVLIKSADRLNTASANAFLKCLEEPSVRTSFILISEQPYNLPATIRSRCQSVCIARPDKQLVLSWMRQQDLKNDTELLLNLAQGSPLVAQHLFEQEAIDYRKSCFQLWLAISQNKKNAVSVAEEWSQYEKSKMDLLFVWLISWVVDVIKLTYFVDSSQLNNPDISSDLQELAERLNLKGLFKYYDYLLQSRSLLDLQLNKQLLFEDILIQWSQLNNS